MSNSLLIAGIVCLVAAMAAAAAGLFRAKVPGLNTVSRQVMLLALGLACLAAGLVLRMPGAGAGAGAEVAASSADSADTCVVQALTCLPRSAGPVVFRNEAAANAAAARNVKDGLSVAQAQAAAEKLGASGEAAQLCGVVQSDESSPLGKHDAAVRLSHPRPGDGKATDACLKMAIAFL